MLSAIRSVSWMIYNACMDVMKKYCEEFFFFFFKSLKDPAIFNRIEETEV